MCVVPVLAPRVKGIRTEAYLLSFETDVRETSTRCAEDL